MDPIVGFRREGKVPSTEMNTLYTVLLRVWACVIPRANAPPIQPAVHSDIHSRDGLL